MTSYLGVHPGASRVGVAIGTRDRLSLLTTLDLGHWEQLSKPREVKKEDGSVRLVERVRVLSLSDVDDLLLRFTQVIQGHPVNGAIVEWVVNYFHQGPPQAIMATASMMARAQWVGGELRRVLSMAGIPTVTVQERAWVSKVLKNLDGRREDVDGILEALYPEALHSAEPPEMDAVGLIRYGFAMDDEEEEKRRKAEVKETPPLVGADLELPGDPPPKPFRGPLVPKNPPRQVGLLKHGVANRQMEWRRAAGCLCTSPRHRRGCPLYRPMEYKERVKKT